MTPEERAELEALRSSVVTLEGKLRALAFISADHLILSMKVLEAVATFDPSERLQRAQEALDMMADIKDQFRREFGDNG